MYHKLCAYCKRISLMSGFCNINFGIVTVHAPNQQAYLAAVMWACGRLAATHRNSIECIHYITNETNEMHT